MISNEIVFLYFKSVPETLDSEYNAQKRDIEVGSSTLAKSLIG